jgi:hypothetical protein
MGEYLMTNTGWQREIGEVVTAQYCGQVVCGPIVEKRVAYGGYVKLTIEVPQGFDVFGTTRFSCTVTEQEIF